MITFDLNEAAEFLRMNPHTLEERARNGEIPGAKAAKRWVFIDVDLADWLRAQYRSEQKPGEQSCRSISVAKPIGASGKSMAGKLEKLLGQKAKPKPKNTTTAAVLNFGAPRS